MGEIPVYLQGFPFPYPRASKSVLEVLTAALGIEIDMDRIASFIERSDKEIEQLYEKFPPEIKEQLDKLKFVSYARPTEPAPITEEDKKRILEDIDKFFKKEPKED
jgi:proteasome assembly chaperone (PAC2) family protein